MKKLTWRWNKPVHWADIARCGMMLGSKNSSAVRKQLEAAVATGSVERVGHGTYQLRRKPRT